MIYFDGETVVVTDKVEFFAVMFGVRVNGPERGEFVVPTGVVEVKQGFGDESWIRWTCCGFLSVSS